MKQNSMTGRTLFQLAFRALLMLVTLAPGLASAQTRQVAQTPESLCVMSFNVRYGTPPPPNSWPERRPLVKQVIADISPDLIGTQEGLYFQVKDIVADLPAYDWIGTGRDGGSQGEFMAVFFKRGVLEPLEFDHFWLSDTPDVIGSTTWGNSNRRMVTWVKFKLLRTGQEFYFFNTHLDHRIQLAREKSADLIRERIAKLDTKLPVILGGDFNADAEANKAYDILTKDGFLTDTWKTAAVREGEGLNTFNDFKGIEKKGQRIDWILTRGDVAVDREEIVTFSRDGKFPSDHFPLVAWLRLVKTK